MSAYLEKENDKLREHNLGLKDSLRYLEKINTSFKIEITNIKNLRKECKSCVSQKKDFDYVKVIIFNSMMNFAIQI